MHRSFLLFSALVLLGFAARHEELPEEAKNLSGEDLVNYINKKATWKAELNPRFAGLSSAELKQFLGALQKPTHKRRRGEPAKDLKLDKAPYEFDAAKNWPQCSSVIGQIQDQSTCGSCWAVSTSSVMNDRLCIASNGSIQTSISALDLMACCSFCGYQCKGGWPDEAFYQFTIDGVVTGSNYTEDSLCKPYPLAPCVLEVESGKHKCPEAPKDYYTCERKCRAGYKQESYKNDKYYGKRVTFFDNQNDAVIVELVKNGPVVAAFSVYEDFYHYKSGVYEHTSGKYVGGHAVRIVGFGDDENGVPYWKVANSWDVFFGEEGHFRIRRGTNECGFESEIVSALADVERSLAEK